MVSSPHAWGCFHPPRRSILDVQVFPTRVGVFLDREFYHILRAWSSPHAWGCFYLVRFRPDRPAVFPTRVGVFPSQNPLSLWGPGLPHTRGGVSRCAYRRRCPRASSPHAWGCFCSCAWPHYAGIVFPTRVGVFPEASSFAGGAASLPHTRGGVSQVSRLFWRWREVFPTRVGVFLSGSPSSPKTKRLPHTRGGVSWTLPKRRTSMRSSPHAWGVSAQSASHVAGIQSSPHAWGCFLKEKGVIHEKQVFPTRVGVFPQSIRDRQAEWRLPHTRGGVSLATSLPVNAWSLPHTRGGVSRTEP